eukprot:scaffold399411_cov62-Attheya_sp.AAC.2
MASQVAAHTYLEVHLYDREVRYISMCITTADADPDPDPAEDAHDDDPLSTSNNPPNRAVPAPPQVSSIGVTPKPKRLRDFLKKTIFYSQNIQGSEKCKEIDSSPYKLEYITTMMKEKGID